MRSKGKGEAELRVGGGGGEARHGLLNIQEATFRFKKSPDVDWRDPYGFLCQMMAKCYQGLESNVLPVRCTH
jgi:hypothetical protein